MIFDPIINWLTQDRQLQCMIAGGFAGILRVIMGWLDSGQPFNFGKFVSTVVRTALFGALAGQAMQEPFAAFFEVYFTETAVHKTYKLGDKKFEFKFGKGEDK